jgi:hypothetical protein
MITKITIVQYPDTFQLAIQGTQFSIPRCGEFKTSLHKIMSLLILSYSPSKIFYIIEKKRKLRTLKLMKNIYINVFILPSRCFK